MTAGPDIFATRGLKPEVRDARGYVHYDKGDLATIRAADPQLARLLDQEAAERHWVLDHRGRSRLVPKNLSGGKTSFTDWIEWATTQEGWAMPKHSVLPHAVNPLIQVRPDPWIDSKGKPRKGVLKTPRTHDHDTDPALRDRGARLAHERGKLHRDPETGSRKGLPPITGMHTHIEAVKYLIPPGANGKRLDANPLTIAEGWDGSDFVVFCLEGALKNDAIVSDGWPCFDVPSVTLWGWDEVDAEGPDDDGLGGAPLVELEVFAQTRLRGIPVLVVCDSDWHRNQAVLDQARDAAEVIREATGAPVAIAAPPEGDLTGGFALDTRRPLRAKLGADDAIAKVEHGGHGLHVLDFRIPYLARKPTLRTIETRLGARRRGDRVNNCLLLLEAVQASAASDGRAFLSRRRMAKVAALIATSNARSAARAAGLHTEAWVPGEAGPRMVSAIPRVKPLNKDTVTECIKDLEAVGAWRVAVDKHKKMTGEDAFTTVAAEVILAPELRPTWGETTVAHWRDVALG